MARYNSSSLTTSINGTATVTSPYSGAFTNLTGTAPYTVTLPAPTLFPGTSQTFYNSTAGTVTLSTPSGLFGGLGASGAGTLAMPTNTVTTVTSDGTNYIVLSEDGSALVATSGSFTGDVGMNGATVSITSGVLTLNPSTSGTMNNVAIGGTTRAAGSFVALNANGQVNFTSNTSSSSTTTGTLVVTGGMGVSGTVYSGGFNGNLTGTIQTAAQPNITSVGASLILTPTNTVGIIRRSAVSGSNGIRIQANAADAINTDANAGAYITIGGGVIGDTYEGNIDIVAYGGNVDANRNQIRFSNRSGANAITERMRINKDGVVGIGTTDPNNSQLHIYGTHVGGHSIVKIQTANDASPATLGFYTSGGARAGLAYYSPSVGMFIETSINEPILFAPNGAEKVRIATSGNVGIGTQNPLFPLQINTSSGGDGIPGIKLTQGSAGGTFNWASSFMNSAMNTSGKNNVMLIGQDQSANNSGYIGFNYQGAGSSSNFMTIGMYAADNLVNIRASGNVGIGTTSPTYKLQVAGTTYFDTSTHSVGTEFQHVSRSFTAPGGGPREIFRVPSSWLCTNGIFSISATRNSFVHGSLWTWTTTHNGAGQGTLTMLSSGQYANVTAYLDVTSDGAATISIDWGAEEGYQVTILKLAGGAIDFSSNGSDWTTVQASRTRYSRSTINNGFKANNGVFDGSLSKGSGTFCIDHPLPELEETHNLVHSFIEGPQADLIYRGRVDLVNGSAEVNIDLSTGMTEGTFDALCRDVQCFTTNESDWTAVRGSVTGNILTIEAESNTATSSVSWMVIGERKDKHMIDTGWTDSNGKPILEPLKMTPGQSSAPYPEEVPVFQQPIQDEAPAE